MDEQELRAFEEALRQDPALQKEVELHKMLIEDLKLAGLSQKIRTIQKKQIKLNKIKLTLIILSLVLIPAVVLILSNRMSQDAPIENKWPDSFPASTDTAIFRPDTLSDASDSIDAEEKISPTKGKETNQAPQHPKKETKEEFATRKDTIPDPELAISLLIDPKLEQMALREYTVPDELVFLRSSEIGSLLDSVKFLFNEEKYTQGLRMLNRSGLQPDELNFWTAHFYFKQGRYEESIRQLQSISEKEITKKRREQIDWYLFLNHLTYGPSHSRDLDRIYQKVQRHPDHRYLKKMTRILSETGTQKK